MLHHLNAKFWILAIMDLSAVQFNYRNGLLARVAQNLRGINYCDTGANYYEYLPPLCRIAKSIPAASKI